MLCYSVITRSAGSIRHSVNHEILLSRISTRFGITGNALLWFQSYVKDREQRVCVQGATSSSKKLICGVPQGSVLGPVLYVMYTCTLGDIVRRHGLSCRFYADDTQLYCSFKPENQTVSVSAIEACVKDVDELMLTNKLKLNKNKTELLVIRSQYRHIPVLRVFKSPMNMSKLQTMQETSELYSTRTLLWRDMSEILVSQPFTI